MRINYKTHPILKILEKGDLSVIKSPSYKQMMDFIHEYFPKYISYFKEITYLSKPFIHACVKAEKRLTSLYLNIIESNDTSDVSVVGTFVPQNNVTMIFRKYNETLSKTETAVFMFTKEGYPLCCFVDNNKNIGKGFISDLARSYYNLTEENGNGFIGDNIINMILFQLFKTYAEVETKLLLLGKEVKKFKRKYINDTKLDITYLDSKWFTTLVRSEGFKVSGHFRLQPKKKNGKWTKELIWINDFEKTGYTSKAKILTQQYCG